MSSYPQITPDWNWGTAEGSREFDRILDCRLTFREKIQWLEEAENLTLAMQASREKLQAAPYPPAPPSAP
jgi:hypothetical protein